MWRLRANFRLQLCLDQGTRFASTPMCPAIAPFGSPTQCSRRWKPAAIQERSATCVGGKNHRRCVPRVTHRVKRIILESQKIPENPAKVSKVTKTSHMHILQGNHLRACLRINRKDVPFPTVAMIINIHLLYVSGGHLAWDSACHVGRIISEHALCTSFCSGLPEASAACSQVS